MENKTVGDRKSEDHAESVNDSDRRGRDRRCRFSLGHMYITTIGWICRREKDRRNKECRDTE